MLIDEMKTRIYAAPAVKELNTTNQAIHNPLIVIINNIVAYIVYIIQIYIIRHKLNVVFPYADKTA